MFVTLIQFYYSSLVSLKLSFNWLRSLCLSVVCVFHFSFTSFCNHFLVAVFSFAFICVRYNRCVDRIIITNSDEIFFLELLSPHHVYNTFCDTFAIFRFIYYYYRYYVCIFPSIAIILLSRNSIIHLFSN